MTFAVLCTQHHCSAVAGQICRTAFQKSNAPSPIASFGSIVRLQRLDYTSLAMVQPFT
jgi:hypothetical protein